jgi:predicted nucleic acid-binding protein
VDRRRTGSARAADIHAITQQEPVYLSPINVAEIRFGLELLKAGMQKQRAIAMLRRLRRKPQLRITLETAETFGRLLAAQTIERDFRLLTANAKDFADIQGLRIVVLKLP